MRIANKIIMILAGLLLMVAAVLKFHEMLSICVPSWQTNKTGFWESYEFLLIQIPLEFALGVWMVSGLFRKAAWIAGTLAYLCFIFVTLTKAMLGAESCGCFGQIHVNPWITLFSIDIPFFLMLAIFWPKGLKLLPPPWPNTFYLLAVAVPTIGLMALAAPALVTFRPKCIKVEEIPNKDAQLRLELHRVKQELEKKQQEADRWKRDAASLQQQLETLRQAHAVPVIPEPNEKAPTEIAPKITDPKEQPPAVEQWDWLQYIVEDDVRAQLAEGMVVILMYHHDCPTCAERVPQYSAYYKEMTEQGNQEFRIAFLAVPPYSTEGPVPADTTCILGTLTDAQKWEITSPYVVALLNGELVKSWKQGTAPEPQTIFDEIFGQ
ncbi:MAG: hypothetical protein L0Y36_05785 [Planctomycetales bacterium]|nr:hypothetical protein [Planctomycetales bacterium]